MVRPKQAAAVLTVTSCCPCQHFWQSAGRRGALDDQPRAPGVRALLVLPQHRRARMARPEHAAAVRALGALQAASYPARAAVLHRPACLSAAARAAASAMVGARRGSGRRGLDDALRDVLGAQRLLLGGVSQDGLARVRRHGHPWRVLGEADGYARALRTPRASCCLDTGSSSNLIRSAADTCYQPPARTLCSLPAPLSTGEVAQRCSALCTATRSWDPALTASSCPNAQERHCCPFYQVPLLVPLLEEACRHKYFHKALTEHIRAQAGRPNVSLERGILQARRETGMAARGAVTFFLSFSNGIASCVLPGIAGSSGLLVLSSTSASCRRAKDSCSVGNTRATDMPS